MLYFSKIRIFSIILFSVFFTFITASNFFNSEDSFFNKRINLGLDLQGGSYLLLEIDNQPIITQKLQNNIPLLKDLLKDNNIRFKNLSIEKNNFISFH